MSMLEAHMNAVESSILQTALIPSNAGHTLHRGTPRENLISNFLSTHLSSNVAIGSGEIFDHQSNPRESRNQFDIVIYRKNYPKLDFGGVNGFLVESVVATIEVKSLLNRKSMQQAVSAAANLKQLEPKYARFASFGWFPPKPLSFVVAYGGPANISTVIDWQTSARDELGLETDRWPAGARLTTAGHSLDGVCVLGMGSHFLCNTPLFEEHSDPRVKTFSWQGERGSLLFFFLALQQACMNMESSSLNTKPYLADHNFHGAFHASDS